MVVQKRIAQPNLLDRINLFFKGSAEFKITDNRLEITIGSQTFLNP